MAKRLDQDQDLQLYRNLMTVPDHFDEGFSWSSLMGAMFIALVMVPGSIYMGLVAGGGVGSAASWVMVILFIEIAKRTHTTLNKAQIFVLFYMTGAAMGMPFSGMLWNQFLVRSQAMIGEGLVEEVPKWVAPTDETILASHNFFQMAWLAPIGLVLFNTFISRIDNAILGYGLFRIASDVEKLPFPMAPIDARAVAALAEDMEQREAGKTSVQWRMFSIGGAIGLVFGFLYLGVPTLTGALLGQTISIFPIPFVDWTGKTQSFLPAVATGLSFDLGSFMFGMVVPFWAVVGAVAGTVFQFALNPTLYHFQVLTSWRPGDSTVETVFKNTVDFYFSFGLGVNLAIAVIGFYSIYTAVREKRKHKQSSEAVMSEKPKGRGDVPWPLVGATYAVSTTSYILFSGWLIGWDPGIMIVLLVYGLFYTPVISYATARLEGMIGQAVNIPFVREAGLILSGYQGIACWFLPMPLHNYGAQTSFYRRCELTGTKFTSIWKTEAILVPFILISSIMYAQFIYSMDEIPSASYPFADQMWELNAKNSVLMYSSTTGGYSQFLDAFRPPVIGYGFAGAILLFSILRAFSAPTFLLFGAVQGLNQTMMHSIYLQFAGALVARYYMERKLGREFWRKYVPVLAAGFSCGVGLVAMFTIGVKFMKTAVFREPF
jgi:hypothetical protein